MTRGSPGNVLGQSVVRIAFTLLMVCANFCNWARIAASVASVAAEASCMIHVSAFSRGAYVDPLGTVVAVVVVATPVVVVAAGRVVAAGTVVVTGTAVATGTVGTTGTVAITVDDVDTPGTVGNGGRVGVAPFDDAHAPTSTASAIGATRAIRGKRIQTTVVVGRTRPAVTRR